MTRPLSRGTSTTRRTATVASPLDDVVDAAAAARSANRIALGTSSSLPDPPEMVDGPRVEIWY